MNGLIDELINERTNLFRFNSIIAPKNIDNSQPV